MSTSDNELNGGTVYLGRTGCKRSIRLKSAGDITRLLGKIMNDVMRNEIDSNTARTVGYLASVFVKALEVSDIQKRLDILEAATDGQERK